MSIRPLLTFLPQRGAGPPVRVGDRFRKANDPFGKAWEVMRIWTSVDALPQARQIGVVDAAVT